jgi:hypothetical protein
VSVILSCKTGGGVVVDGGNDVEFGGFVAQLGVGLSRNGGSIGSIGDVELSGDLHGLGVLFKCCNPVLKGLDGGTLLTQGLLEVVNGDTKLLELIGKLLDELL